MKRSVVAICLLTFLFTTSLTACSNPSPLQEAMNDYSKIVEGELPDDIRLTIYYLDPNILTRIPLSKDDLATFPGVGIITVNSEELASCWELLKELNPSILHPVQEESYINARLYYVFEVGDSDEILEVVINNIHGNAFVNGIEVEDNPIFYELIVHHLPEEVRITLGI